MLRSRDVEKFRPIRLQGLRRGQRELVKWNILLSLNTENRDIKFFYFFHFLFIY